MFDGGSGSPVILIPGVQGRWEWMRPAYRALAKQGRAIGYSLCGDVGSDMRIDAAAGFDNFVRQLDGVYEKAGIERAALAGVSYGGLIAVRYAALRPERVSHLVIVSSPAPGWKPTVQQQRYVDRPWLTAPLFTVTSPMRLWPEIRSACGSLGSGLAFAAAQTRRVMSALPVPPLMAQRIRLLAGHDFAADCARVQAPALVVTGEDDLDRVVPAQVTRRYVELIRGARYQRFERTGHIGLVTRPERFAEIVGGFCREPGL